MNELLTRVRDLYVAPSHDVPTARPARCAPAPAAVVMGAPRDAAAVAAGLGLGLARAGGWPCALLGLWRAGEPPGWRLPAGRAAWRLSADFRAQGLEAQASGRLARAWLPPSPGAALAAAELAVGRVRVPVVLALAGPREVEIEGLLRLADVIVLACGGRDDPALAAAAQAGLAGLAAPTVVCEPTTGRVTAGLALAGAGVLPALHAALGPAVRVAT